MWLAGVGVARSGPAAGLGPEEGGGGGGCGIDAAQVWTRGLGSVMVVDFDFDPASSNWALEASGAGGAGGAAGPSIGRSDGGGTAPTPAAAAAASADACASGASVSGSSFAG